MYLVYYTYELQKGRKVLRSELPEASQNFGNVYKHGGDCQEEMDVDGCQGSKTMIVEEKIDKCSSPYTYAQHFCQARRS